MEKMWHYVKDGTERLGPIPESELRALANTGQIQPGDLVWCEGMADWVPYETAPGLSGAAPVAAHPAQAGAAPASASYGHAPAGGTGGHGVPPGLAGWLKFVGVFTLVGSVLMFICGIAVLIGGAFAPRMLVALGFYALIYIVGGAVAWMAGKACTRGSRALFGIHSADESTYEFLCHMKRFFTIVGVYYLISVIITVLLVVFMLVAGVSSLPF